MALISTIKVWGTAVTGGNGIKALEVTDNDRIACEDVS